MKPVVMVIDDDLGISNFLSLALTEHGYKPITASNGSAALNALKHGILPSLILTDYSMPVLNGCEFIEHASLQNHLQHIPILMMTGSHIADLTLPTSDNFKGVILKPFELNTVLETISYYLRKEPYSPSCHYMSSLK